MNIIFILITFSDYKIVKKPPSSIQSSFSRTHTIGNIDIGGFLMRQQKLSINKKIPQMGFELTTHGNPVFSY